MNLSGADLSDVDLSFSLMLNLNEDKLRDINIDNKTILSGILIDGDELLLKISSPDLKDVVKLISNQQDLEKQLLDRGYPEYHIEQIVENSRCK